MNSLELHNVLRSAFAEAERIIQAETGTSKAIGFSIHAGGVYASSGAIHFSITTGYTSSSDAVEVKGRDFWDCVSEFIRRISFAERQAHVQLGPPTIDQTSAEPKG